MKIVGRLDSQGVADAIAALASFKEAMQRRIIYKSLAYAQTPMVEQARRLAPVDPYATPKGTLRKSLAVKLTIYPASNTVVAVIGPQRNMKREVRISAKGIFRQIGGNKGKYGRGTYSHGKLISAGRVIVAGVLGKTKRFTHFNKGGKWTFDRLSRIQRDPNKIAHLLEGGTKHRPAFHFMQAAFLTTRNQCSQRFAEKVAENIEKEAAKLYTRQ